MQKSLEELKELATSLGIEFHPKIGVEALTKKIADFENEMQGKSEPDLDLETIIENNLNSPKQDIGKVKSLRQHLIDNEMALVRVRVTCLDPKKKDLKGEIWTVSNRYLGTVRKFIPYTANEAGYHIPKCLLTVLKDSKFVSIKVVKDSRGRESIESAYVNQFVIDELPQLSKKELADLAAAQAAAGVE